MDPHFIVIANADSNATNLIRFIVFAVTQTATAGAAGFWRAGPGYETRGRLKLKRRPSKAWSLC